MRRLSALLITVALAVPSISGGLAGSASAGAFDMFIEEGGRKFRQLDPSGDADFSQTCVVDDREPNQSYIGEPPPPNTGVSAVNCENQLSQGDITEYSLRFIPKSSAEALKNPYDTTQSVSTLEAKWTFVGVWPAKGTLAPVQAGTDLVTGLSADIRFRNPYLQINDLWPVCDTTRATTSNPTKRASRPGTEHWLDQHYWFIGFNYNLDATDGWDGLIQLGHYVAFADDGFGHVIIDFETDPPYNRLPGPEGEPGLGIAYDYVVSDTDKTVTVRVPTTVLDESGVCLKTHDGTANNNLKVKAPGQEIDLEEESGLDLPDEPGTIGANRGLVGGTWYEPFALSADDRANAPRSVVNSQRFAYPPGHAADNNDRLVDIAAVSGVSFLVGTPFPIPVGDVTGPTICKVMDGELPSIDIDGDGKNDNPGAPIRCGSGLREGGEIQWILSSSATVDRSSLKDGSPTFRPSFDPFGLFTPLLTTTVYGGTGCVTAVKPIVVGTPGVVGMTRFGLAGMSAGVDNPLVTPGQACGILNPLGSRNFAVPGAEVVISE